MISRTVFTSLYQVTAIIKDYGYVTCIVLANGRGDACERLRKYYSEHNLTVSKITHCIKSDYDVREI